MKTFLEFLEESAVIPGWKPGMPKIKASVAIDSYNAAQNRLPPKLPKKKSKPVKASKSPPQPKPVKKNHTEKPGGSFVGGFLRGMIQGMRR